MRICLLVLVLAGKTLCLESSMHPGSHQHPHHPQSHYPQSHHLDSYHPRLVNGTNFTDCPLQGDCTCCDENKIFCQFGEGEDIKYKGCIDFYKRFSCCSPPSPTDPSWLYFHSISGSTCRPKHVTLDDVKNNKTCPEGTRLYNRTIVDYGVARISVARCQENECNSPNANTTVTDVIVEPSEEETDSTTEGTDYKIKGTHNVETDKSYVRTISQMALMDETFVASKEEIDKAIGKTASKEERDKIASKEESDKIESKEERDKMGKGKASNIEGSDFEMVEGSGPTTEESDTTLEGLGSTRDVTVTPEKTASTMDEIDTIIDQKTNETSSTIEGKGKKTPAITIPVTRCPANECNNTNTNITVPTTDETDTIFEGLGSTRDVTVITEKTYDTKISDPIQTMLLSSAQNPVLFQPIQKDEKIYLTFFFSMAILILVVVFIQLFNYHKNKRDSYKLSSYQEQKQPISLIGVKIVDNKNVGKRYDAMDLDHFIYNYGKKEDVDVAIYGEEGYTDIVKDFKLL